MSQLPPGRIHEIVDVELTVGQTLSLARLVRAQLKRTERRHAKSTFVPEEGKRDAELHAIDSYRKLLDELLNAAGLDDLDEGRPNR